jgi:osmoprotectant transport system permease protein
VTSAAVSLHTFIDAFRFIGSNWSFLLGKAGQQLDLAGAALGLAMALVLPIGIVLGHLRRGSTIAIGASIVGRALPVLVLIAAFLTVLGIGFVNNMVALAVLASGPILTNSYEGVARVEASVVDAARASGMTAYGVLRKVELPLALPPLAAGIRVAAVTVIATAPIAAIAGGGGLGDVIVNQASYGFDGVLGASLCAMALSVLTYAVLKGLERAITPAGLRRLTALEKGNRPRKLVSVAALGTEIEEET